MIEKYKRFFRINFKKMIRRKTVSSHSISMGFAWGVFVAFSPFVGLQIVIVMGICFLFNYNKVAGILGVFVSNPFTFFPIYFFNYYVGNLLLGELLGSNVPLSKIKEVLQEPTISDLVSIGFNTILVFSFGCLVVGIIVAFFSYFIVKILVSYYREKRRFN